MFKVRVEAWTDWSTGRPRPAFTVRVAREDKGSVYEEMAEELAASAAVDRLERELRWISENADSLVYSATIDDYGYSKYALYAMVLLAAARANVNPAIIEFDYLSERPPVKSYDLKWMIIDFEEVFDPHRNIMRHAVWVLDDYLKGELHGKLPAIEKPLDINIINTWEALDALAQALTLMGDNPDLATRIWFLYALEDLSIEARSFEAWAERELSDQDVEDILLRAAREARDPDVELLARILAEIVHEVERMASAFRFHLDFQDILDNNFGSPPKVLGMTKSPEKIKEGLQRVQERLESAKAIIQEIERKVNPLISEARKIIERLEERGPLLDMELESEEEIKKRLLEA